MARKPHAWRKVHEYLDELIESWYEEDEEEEEAEVDIDLERPRTRGDCVNGVRPCPWVGCRHHLWLDTYKEGRLRFRVDVPPWELEHSCALDVADEGPHSEQEIAEIMALSDQAVRIVENSAMKKMLQGIAEHLGPFYTEQSDLCFREFSNYGIKREKRLARQVRTKRGKLPVLSSESEQGQSGV